MYAVSFKVLGIDTKHEGLTRKQAIRWVHLARKDGIELIYVQDPQGDVYRTTGVNQWEKM
jgi:hypothetical protein